MTLRRLSKMINSATPYVMGVLKWQMTIFVNPILFDGIPRIRILLTNNIPNTAYMSLCDLALGLCSQLICSLVLESF
jgi:hypothetical protein